MKTDLSNLSIGKLITIIISILLGGGLIENLIWNYPITEGSKWLWQFIPSFIGNIYVFFLSQLLLPDLHNLVLLILVLLIAILTLYVSQLASIIKTWLDIKKMQIKVDIVGIDSSSENALNEVKQELSALPIQTPLIQVSLVTMFSFILVIWFSSFFMWQNIFESNIIILSSRHSYNEVNSYRMKWLTMRTKEAFFELMNTMNKDVKNVQIESKKT